MNEKFEIAENNTLQNAINVVEEKIPQNVVSIRSGTSDDYAFLKSKSTITKVLFEDNSNLETIGDYSFFLCSQLTVIDLSNCLLCNTIGYCAFAYCRKLNEIHFPPNIRTIQGNFIRSVHLQKTINLSGLTFLASIAFVDNEF